jgi:hypothetical protein
MIIEVVGLKGCFWCTRVVELFRGEGLRIHSYKSLDKSSPDSYESDLASVRHKLGSPPDQKISFPDQKSRSWPPTRMRWLRVNVESTTSRIPMLVFGHCPNLCSMVLLCDKRDVLFLFV